MLLNKNIGLILIGLLYTCSAYAVPTCALSVVTDVAFGTYDPFNATALDTNGQLNVTCSGSGNTPTFTVSLNTGNLGSYTPRRMSSGPETLNYNLYINTARTTIWGDGTSGTSVVSETRNCKNAGCNYIVYSRIPALQTTAAVGAYSDSITVTLTF
jgi:spore coat protein U-like protein